MSTASSDYMRMLREAQIETSAYSSSKVSPVYSLRNSNISTPKSPPNSPNTELATLEDRLGLHGVFINRDPELETASSSSRSSRSKVVSMHSSKVKKREDWFKKKVLATLLMTHMVAMGLGLTIGIWVLRKKV